MSRVAVLTGEVVGPRLAGPAIRALAMAEALGAEHEVTVLAASVADPPDGPYRVEALGDAACERAAAGDVLIVQDQPLPLTVLAAMPVLATSESG